MDDREITVRATKGQIQDFLESFLWKDMKRELGAWKKGFDSEMRSIVEDSTVENPSTATVLMRMGDINGRVKAVDYLLSLPNIFLHILEEQRDDNRRNET